jgi:thiamine biosynthesis lipoprotein
MTDLSVKVIDYGNYKAHSFFCMGGLCEVLIETNNTATSNKIFEAVYNEAKRIEKKYSRYDKSNPVHNINSAKGHKVKIDSETYRLLTFADTLYRASDGFFDITSGVLRKIWTFDGGSHIPEKSQIQNLVKKIGWKHVVLEKNWIQIPAGWELDFGGIGKEYAVDSCTTQAQALKLAPTLINLGGDISITGAKKDNSPWKISVDQSEDHIMLLKGAVATSGDKNKYVLHNNKRLSHILNPKTGWPIENAPRSVTVVADTCSEAGALSTLSLLHGKQAEAFLKSEAKEFKVIW